MLLSPDCVSLHRKLGMAGQKLGSSAVLCYIRHDTAEPGSSFTLTVANVGTCQAVLCRGGKPLLLSKVFSLEQCPEETRRVQEQKAIITEVGPTPPHPSAVAVLCLVVLLHGIHPAAAWGLWSRAWGTVSQQWPGS